MKNQTLGTTRCMIPYYKDLNSYTGSVTASVLMAQLEYWFSKMEGKEFFKFLEPCDRKDYKVGDSWVEELGFSKYEFRTAFSKIGQSYKSKKQYLNSQDPFMGKLYLSYHDRMERRTYYLRNHEKVDQILDQWTSKKGAKATYVNQESQLPEMKELPLEKEDKSISRSGESGLPITVDYNSKLRQEIKAGDYTEDKDGLTDQKIVDLFNHICPSLPQVQIISDGRKKAIAKLRQYACQDRGVIESLFKRVEVSDFLCGRSGGWKASFDWIIKQNNMIKIMEGNYDNLRRGPSNQSNSLTDQLTSQAVQDFINDEGDGYE